MIWRVRFDPAADGDSQMQQDQLCYSHFEPEQEQPLLRFYTWSEPTLSIGRFQTLSDDMQQRLKQLGIPVVRRPTGGQAILHGGDLTFSLVSAHTGPLKGSVTQSFTAFASGVIKGLQELGLSAGLGEPQPETKHLKEAHCFSQTTNADICLGSQKLVGAAQVRCRKSLLIQAVIYRKLNHQMLQAIFNAPTTSTDLATHLKQVPDHQTLARYICEGFEKRWGVRFRSAAAADAALASAPLSAD